MKNITKILSIIVVMAMMVSTVSFAADFSDVAKDKPYYEAVSVLSAFGIINGYEDGTFGPDKDVTRAEFATMLMRAMASSGLGSPDPAGTPFTDLADASWAISDIKTAYDLKIINGMTETTFEPNSNVTYEQALKMIVCALNYGSQAESVQTAAPNQPWYYGYVQTAYSLKLTNGINVAIGTPAKRWEIAQMIFNAFDVKILEKVEVAGGGEYYQQTENTLLNSKLNITKSRGEVYADETNTIAPSGAVARAGYALIYDSADKTTYTIAKGDVAVSDYIGKTVDYYYKTDVYGEKTLLFVILKSGTTSTVKIDAINLASVTGSYASGFTVEYYASDTSTSISRLKTEAKPVVSINGVVVTNPTAGDLMIEFGTLEFISTDSGYSKISVEAYETYVVKSVNNTDKYIVDMYRPSSTNTLYLDDEDGNVILNITNTAGKNVSFSAISQHNVLSVKVGQGASNRTSVDVRVSSQTTSGTIREIDLSEGVINVGGTEYKVSKYLDMYAPTALSSLEVGDTCKLCLDINGDVAYAEKTASTSSYYGYMAGAGEKSGVVKIAVISSKNTSMGSPTLSVAKKVKIDGETYSNTDDILYALSLGGELNNIDGNGNTYSQLIKYSLNSSGEINAIETANFGENEDYDDETVFQGFDIDRKAENVLTYKSSSYDFVGDSSSDKFRINSSTQVFIVPLDRDDYESYGRKSYNYFKDSVNYIVEAYDVTGSLKVAKAVVVYETEETADAIEASSPLFIITGVTQTINDNGDECDKVTGHEISSSGSVSENKVIYTSQPGIIDDNYSIGDVIIYVTNNKGYVTAGSTVLKGVFSPSDFDAYDNYEKKTTGSHYYELYSGLLIGSDVDGSKQMFDVARTTDIDECETATVDSFTASSSVTYFTYEETESGNVKVTKQDGMLDLASFPSYNETIEAETPSAAKMFVYEYDNAVKMVYLIK